MNLLLFILSLSSFGNFYGFFKGAPIQYILAPLLLVAVVILGGAAFIGVGLVVFRFVQKGRQQRAQALHFWGTQNGWQPVADPGLSIFQNHESYHIFSRGQLRQLVGTLQKPLDDGQAYLFDYTYQHGSGENERKSYQTVVAFHTPHLNLPFFALYPESFFSILGEIAGNSDIDFDSHPKFSKQFKLSGKDEANIRRVFTPQALSFLEQFPKIRVDAGGNYLFVYVTDQMSSLENLNQFENLAQNIYGQFRQL